MKIKIIIKIVVLAMIILSFTARYVLYKTYFYFQRLNKYVNLEGYTTDGEKRDSPIRYIALTPINYADHKTSEKVEILSDKIKAVYNGKEYYLNITKNKTSVLPYKEGVILKEGTVLYFGKVRVDDKMIIDMPPVTLKQTLKVNRYNPITDGLKEVYHGPADKYKGR